MAREKNTIDTIQITLAVTEPIRDMLENLSKSGFFGKNAADTAGILLREKLRELYGHPQTPGFQSFGFSAPLSSVSGPKSPF